TAAAACRAAALDDAVNRIVLAEAAERQGFRTEVDGTAAGQRADGHAADRQVGDIDVTAGLVEDRGIVSRVVAVETGGTTVDGNGGAAGGSGAVEIERSGVADGDAGMGRRRAAVERDARAVADKGRVLRRGHIVEIDTAAAIIVDRRASRRRRVAEAYRCGRVGDLKV